MALDDVLLPGPIRAPRTFELRLDAALETQVACQRLFVLILAVALETLPVVELRHRPVFGASFVIIGAAGVALLSG